MSPVRFGTPGARGIGLSGDLGGRRKVVRSGEVFGDVNQERLSQERLNRKSFPRSYDGHASERRSTPAEVVPVRASQPDAGAMENEISDAVATASCTSSSSKLRPT